MGKPTICIGENKGADQLRSYCAFVFAVTTPTSIASFQSFLLFFLIFKAVTIKSYKEDNCFTAVRKQDKVLESGHLFVSRIR